MPKRKRSYTRHRDPVEYRVVERAPQVAGTSRRSVGSLGRLTPRMMDYNALRLAGVPGVDAAKRAGYGNPYDAVERNSSHPSLIAYNAALLARHGLTVDSVAEGIRSALDALQVVGVRVGEGSKHREGENILVRVPDNVARLRACELLADLLGMTPRSRDVCRERARVAEPGHPSPDSASTGLKGAALRKEFASRLADFAAAQKTRVVVRDDVSRAVIEVEGAGCGDELAREIARAGGLREWSRIQSMRRRAARRRQGSTTNTR